MLCIVDSAQQLVSVVVCKGEAYSCAVKLIIWLNGIFKSARFTDNRHCAVSEGYELSKSAGFKEAGNKNSVGSRIYLMSKALVKEDICGYSAGHSHGIFSEQIFILRIACTNNNKLSELVADAVKGISYKVKTLLIGETGDYADNEFILINRQTKLLLESLLVGSLALLYAAGAVLLCDAGIGLGVICLIVDTITIPQRD